MAKAKFEIGIFPYVIFNSLNPIATIRSLSRNGINLFLERLRTHGRKLQRGRGRFDYYVEKITLVWQCDRRYDGSRGDCRDKVADREEGGTGEAAAETRSASTASTGECEISCSLAHIRNRK